jgi:uncharacterized protein YkwD
VLRMRLVPVLLACALAALPLAACAGARGTAPVPAETDADTDPRARAEAQVLELVNSYRNGRGLPRLLPDDHLTRVAREYSEAMARGGHPFGHEGIEARARRVGERVRFLSMGENLYAVQPVSPLSSWRAVTGWLESPPHREVIEGCFDRSGVGAAVDSAGQIYYTQLFLLEARPARRPVRAGGPPRAGRCR